MKIVDGVLTSVTAADLDANGHFYSTEVIKVANEVFYDMDGLVSVDLPNCTEIGNYCFRHNQALTTVSLPALTTCGNYCFHSNLALTTVSLPALTTCGNDCFRHNQALTTVRINKHKLNVMDVDGYCYVIATQRTTKGVAVYTGYNLVKMVDGAIEKNESYVAEKEGFKAHGESLKQAINDLHFKIAAEKIKKDPIYPETIVSIMHYRTITGACEFGCKGWLERNGLKDTTEMKASELVPLLKKTGAWGSDKFMQLIQF